MNRRSEGALNVLMCAAGMVAAAASAAERPPPPEDGALVAADGTGQFKAIQDAVNAAPPNCSQEQPWTIRIRAGTYHELVYAQREKHFVRLVGEDPARTTVTFGLCASMPGPDGKPLGTFHTQTVWIDADNFSIENLTLENSAVRRGQALALRVDGDRATFPQLPVRRMAGHRPREPRAAIFLALRDFGRRRFHLRGSDVLFLPLPDTLPRKNEGIFRSAATTNISTRDISLTIIFQRAKK